VNTVSNVFVQTFENNVRHLAQQSETKLRGKVQERSVSSENHNWERLGTIEATVKSTRLQATPSQDTPWSRRVSLAQTFQAADSTEQEDPVQMLVDPNSNLTRALASAMKRKVDGIIIDAATGNSTDGAGGAVVFPAGQKLGTGIAAISFDDVTAVQELFMQNNIDPDIPKCAIVGPTQVRKLMQLTEQTSSDYVNRQALQQLNASGIVPNWMGFTWIMSTLLLAPGGGELSCLFMTDQAIGLQVNKDITARVAEDPSASFAWRIYLHATMGATRVEDEQIVHLHVLDSI
jgi:hypothetical protein